MQDIVDGLYGLAFEFLPLSIFLQLPEHLQFHKEGPGLTKTKERLLMYSGGMVIPSDIKVMWSALDDWTSCIFL